MREDERCVRGFHWNKKAWYAGSLPCNLNEIDFGVYDQKGGCKGEMTMEWHDLTAGPAPQLKCFDDGWAVLATFSDLIIKLGNVAEENISQEKFIEILIELGFKDLTKYTRPKEDA